MTKNLLFADADSDFESSRYVILGIPHDETGSHRKGAGQAPKSMREESYNFETYLYDLDIDLVDVAIHDLGDIKIDSVPDTIRKILKAKKIPIALGGEHSISPAIISEFGNISVLVFDAHLDFRDEYEGNRNSHACTTRRISELVGAENVIPIGVRSMCKEELADAKRLGLEFITVNEMLESNQDKILKRLDDKLSGNVYISLDMDAIDPAFAPGVGTPEPVGLTPCFVQKIIRHFSDRAVGFDVVEVCPPYDNGNTASLAAKLVRDFIGAKEKF